MSDFDDNYERGPGAKDRAVDFYNSHIGRRVVISLSIVLAGVIVMLTLSLLPRKPREIAATDTERRLEGIPVKMGPVELTVSGFGKAMPVQMIDISAEVKAMIKVKRTNLKAGTLVRKDEILLELNAGDYEASLKMARAEVRRLKSEKAIKHQYIAGTEKELQKQIRVGELEETFYQRIKALAAKNASSRTDLEKAEMAKQIQDRLIITTNRSLSTAKLEQESLDAQIAKAEGEENIAELNIRRCTVRSPVTGRLRNIFVDQGEYVNVGTKLFEIADDSRLEIPVFLEAGEAVKVLPLQTVDSSYANWFADTAGLPVEIAWVEDPGRCSWSGKIVRLDRFDPETGTFNFIVSPERPLRPDARTLPLVDGMFCRVTFIGRTLPHAMRIPWTAIQYENSVYVADRGGRLQQRPVKVYCSNGDQLVVDSGLNDGEKLILQKLPRGAVNGMKVKVIPPAAGKYETAEPKPAADGSGKPAR